MRASAYTRTTSPGRPTPGGWQRGSAGRAAVGKVVKERLLANTNAAQKFLLLAIVFSPFQKAFTISIGSPLKISEILIGAAILVLPFSRSGKVTSLAVERVLVLVIGGFVIASTAYALLLPTPNGSFLGYDRGLVNDLVFYLIYSLLILIAWWMMVGLDRDKIARAVGIAVRLCVLACALQYALWAAGNLALIRTFGYVLVQGAAYGAAIPRNGPFMEGNYLGFFGGVALFICLRRRDLIGVVASVFCLLFSQSTNAILAVVVGLVATALLRPAVKWQSILGLGALIVGVIFLVVPQFQRFLTFQLGKIGVSDGAGDASEVNRSIEIRSSKSNTGIDMALDHPIFGVGPGRFGVWYSDYADGSIDTSSASGSGRPLAENAYVQLASEVGIIAVIALFGLLAVLAIRSLQRSRMDFALTAFMGTALVAAPSWTTLTIWIALAYLGSSMRSDDDGLRVDAAPRAPRTTNASSASRRRSLAGSVRR